jgi:hypothetical protein
MQLVTRLSVPGISVSFVDGRFQIRNAGGNLLTAGCTEHDECTVRSHVRALVRAGF